MSPLQQTLLQFNDSYSNPPHKYLGVGDSTIQLTNKRQHRASFQKIADTVGNLFEKFQLPLDVLKELQTSLMLVQHNYLAKYNLSLIGRLQNSSMRMGVIIAAIISVVFQFFGWKKQQIETLDQLINRLNLKIKSKIQEEKEQAELIESLSEEDSKETGGPEEEDLLATTEALPEPAESNTEEILQNLGGIKLEGIHFMQPFEAPFAFWKRDDHLAVKIKHPTGYCSVNFSLANVEDVSLIIQLLMELHHHQEIEVISPHETPSPSKKLSISFVDSGGDDLHLQIRSCYPPIEIPLREVNVNVLLRSITGASTSTPTFTFTEKAYEIPPVQHIPSISKKMTGEHLTTLLIKYYPGVDSLKAWPSTLNQPLIEAILVAYYHGTNCSVFDKDTPLQQGLNEQYITSLQQIFDYMDKLDQNNQSGSHTKEIEGFCKDIVMAFQLCQAARVQTIFPLYQSLYNLKATFEEYLRQAWVDFKEGIFDSLLPQLSTVLPDGVDVHVRNAFLQQVGIQFGFSPLLVENALKDPNVNLMKNSTHTVPSDTAKRYETLLVEQFPNFVRSIAHYINSLSSNEGVIFQEWVKKNEDFPPGFGFHSDYMVYDGTELSEIDKQNVEHREAYESQETFHISLYEVYQILEWIGMIKLKEPLRLLRKEEIIKTPLPPFLQEIDLGGILGDVEDMTWFAGGNTAFEIGEPVFICCEDYYQVAVILEIGDTSELFDQILANFVMCDDGNETVKKPLHQIRKLKVKTRWSQNSLKRLEGN